MQSLFDRQLAKACKDSGAIDIDVLRRLVIGAYEEMDSDKRRTDRSISLMIEELEQAHEQLVDAFEVIPEGIALFDAEDRFVIWNKHYADLYDRSAGEIRIGMRFEEMLRDGLARGQYPDAVGREELWLADRLRKHRTVSSSHEQKLSGGRWLRIEERRTHLGGSVGVRIDITELKQREESFRLLFTSNPIPMCVCDASSLRLSAVNEAALDHYGYTREQVEGMSVLDLRHPDDRASAKKLGQNGEASHQSGEIRRHIKADGTEIEVAIYSKPMVYAGVPSTLFAVIDVTEQRRARRMLEQQKAQLDAALDNMSQGLCMYDAEGHITLFNDNYARFLGAQSESLTGKSLLDVFEHLRAAGELQDDPKAFFDRVLANARSGKPQLIIRETPAGRILRIVQQPMKEGGWVTTVEDVTEVKRAEAQIVHLAQHDPLTDLPNRTLFKEKMSEALGPKHREGQLAVFCLDLDHFKDVNDSLGHPVGDQLLIAVGQRLRRTVRDSDTVARLGGDEFAVIQVGREKGEIDSEALARRIVDVLSAPYQIDGQEIVIGVSVGISMSPADTEDPDQLMRNADMALYRAKADGRGTYRFFEPEMDARARARRTLELDLRRAVVKGEFEPFFQPVVDLRNNEIVGFEALLRWNHPTRGLVPPMSFVPLAEETGLIVPIGEWILRKACKEAASWTQPLRIAVNLSPVQFKSRNLVASVRGALETAKLDPHRLELEITESVLLDSTDNNIQTLHALKALGVRIAMDDFGTGYSSLSYLRSFPFDKIKIDQSFIREIASRDDSMAIVRAVTGLGKTLGITTTAEGVETEEQLLFVRQEGCTEVQGYLFSKPIPAREAERLIDSHRIVKETARAG